MSKRQIELTEAEHGILIKNERINSAFEKLLEEFVKDGESCHLCATPHELSELTRYVGDEAKASTDRKIKKDLQQLFNYLKTL